MKNIITMLIAATCIAIGCADAQTVNKSKNEKVLTVYFTKTNNTELIAKHIQSLIGGNLLRIETQIDYPQEYKAATEAAKKEKESNTRPLLKTKVDKIDEYDTIFVGFPIWWSDTPMAIATFLESYNLSGKIIIPFCTHGGGGVGEAFNRVKSLTPNSTNLNGFVYSGSRAASAMPDVEKWLKEIKVIK